MNFHFSLYDLVDLCFIDINMNDLCLLGIAVNISRYTVIETHAYGNQYIAFISIYVRPIVAMHPQEPDIIRMIGGKSP
jgi:hypothetical protein